MTNVQTSVQPSEPIYSTQLKLKPLMHGTARKMNWLTQSWKVTTDDLRELTYTNHLHVHAEGQYQFLSNHSQPPKEQPLVT